MYSKILIANRGEIAVRIIRACRELGVRTVAIHSLVDREALHVLLADERICIGPAPSSESYLKIPAIIAAAEVSGAEAIHPGYGFLSEDNDFAEKCTTSGIDFIGPHYKTIFAMGDKIEGRKAAKEANVPTIPGTAGAVNDDESALAAAKKIGFPLMVKATAGGGGKGMRVVHSPASFLKAYELARAEAQAAFGNSDIFIEKYIENPRHVEVQILGDKHGNVVHLGERDCSIQRRHQKIIEESPAPHLPTKVRTKICEAAVRLAKKIGYYSAGTMEFLVDKDFNFYFIEMNTRLQVEHPITEMVAGIDLVKNQILVAAGQKLPFTQKDIHFRGHAIECRINAEDPEKFRPSPGTLSIYREPGGYGVRVDSGVYQGARVQPYYDSLMAKLISFGADREEARLRMLRALSEYHIEGVKTLLPLHHRVLSSLNFKEGQVSTNFLTDFIEE